MVWIYTGYCGSVVVLCSCCICLLSSSVGLVAVWSLGLLTCAVLSSYFTALVITRAINDDFTNFVPKSFEQGCFFLLKEVQSRLSRSNGVVASQIKSGSAAVPMCMTILVSKFQSLNPEKCKVKSSSSSSVDDQNNLVEQQLSALSQHLHDQLVLPWYLGLSPDGLSHQQLSGVLEDVLLSCWQQLRQAGGVRSLLLAACDVFSQLAIAHTTSSLHGVHGGSATTAAGLSPEVQQQLTTMSQLIVLRHLPPLMLPCKAVVLLLRDLLTCNFVVPLYLKLCQPCLILRQWGASSVLSDRRPSVQEQHATSSALNNDTEITLASHDNIHSDDVKKVSDKVEARGKGIVSYRAKRRLNSGRRRCLHSSSLGKEKMLRRILKPPNAIKCGAIFMKGVVDGMTEEDYKTCYFFNDLPKYIAPLNFRRKSYSLPVHDHNSDPGTPVHSSNSMPIVSRSLPSSPRHFVLQAVAQSGCNAHLSSGIEEHNVAHDPCNIATSLVRVVGQPETPHQGRSKLSTTSSVAVTHGDAEVPSKHFETQSCKYVAVSNDRVDSSSLYFNGAMQQEGSEPLLASDNFSFKSDYLRGNSTNSETPSHSEPAGFVEANFENKNSNYEVMGQTNAAICSRIEKSVPARAAAYSRDPAPGAGDTTLCMVSNQRPAAGVIQPYCTESHAQLLLKKKKLVKMHSFDHLDDVLDAVSAYERNSRCSAINYPCCSRDDCLQHSDHCAALPGRGGPYTERNCRHRSGSCGEVRRGCKEYGCELPFSNDNTNDKLFLRDARDVATPLIKHSAQASASCVSCSQEHFALISPTSRRTKTPSLIKPLHEYSRASVRYVSQTNDRLLPCHGTTSSPQCSALNSRPAGSSVNAMPVEKSYTAHTASCSPDERSVKGNIAGLNCMEMFKFEIAGAIHDSAIECPSKLSVDVSSKAPKVDVISATPASQSRVTDELNVATPTPVDNPREARPSPEVLLKVRASSAGSSAESKEASPEDGCARGDTRVAAAARATATCRQTRPPTGAEDETYDAVPCVRASRDAAAEVLEGRDVPRDGRLIVSCSIPSTVMQDDACGAPYTLYLLQYDALYLLHETRHTSDAAKSGGSEPSSGSGAATATKVAALDASNSLPLDTCRGVSNTSSLVEAAASTACDTSPSVAGRGQEESCEVEGSKVLPRGQRGDQTHRLILHTSSVQRRFREFVCLHEALWADPKLRVSLLGVTGPSRWRHLPHGKLTAATVSMRRTFLENYMRILLQRVDVNTSLTMRQFLCYGSDAQFGEFRLPYEVYWSSQEDFSSCRCHEASEEQAGTCRGNSGTTQWPGDVVCSSKAHTGAEKRPTSLFCHDSSVPGQQPGSSGTEDLDEINLSNVFDIDSCELNIAITAELQPCEMEEALFEDIVTGESSFSPDAGHSHDAASRHDYCTIVTGASPHLTSSPDMHNYASLPSFVRPNSNVSANNVGPGYSALLATSDPLLAGNSAFSQAFHFSDFGNSVADSLSNALRHPMCPDVGILRRSVNTLKDCTFSTFSSNPPGNCVRTMDFTEDDLAGDHLKPSLFPSSCRGTDLTSPRTLSVSNLAGSGQSSAEASVLLAQNKEVVDSPDLFRRRRSYADTADRENDINFTKDDIAPFHSNRASPFTDLPCPLISGSASLPSPCQACAPQHNIHAETVSNLIINNDNFPSLIGNLKRSREDLIQATQPITHRLQPLTVMAETANGKPNSFPQHLRDGHTKYQSMKDTCYEKDTPANACVRCVGSAVPDVVLPHLPSVEARHHLGICAQYSHASDETSGNVVLNCLIALHHAVQSRAGNKSDFVLTESVVQVLMAWLVPFITETVDAKLDQIFCDENVASFFRDILREGSEGEAAGTGRWSCYLHSVLGGERLWGATAERELVDVATLKRLLLAALPDALLKLGYGEQLVDGTLLQTSSTSAGQCSSWQNEAKCYQKLVFSVH
ncbi:uncharacterized protein LOC108669627 [Hyalella azteca]|uniref:Uncharacterized protein LOC108669627 n=1 Tax=Hyalella azteca TaxID=294128 RepID=A0A979FN06_HYAAZ|nr:uncharacterized protein LOC108669627 [Hyalella azteca]